MRGDCYQDHEAKRLKNSGSSFDWNFSSPPRFFLLNDVPMRWRCRVAAGSLSRVVTLMNESSSTLCMSSPPRVHDFFLKRREDFDEPGLTSCFCSFIEWISMLFWYLSALLLRGRISSPRATLGTYCLALQILLLGVMNTSRFSDTSDGFGRLSFLPFMENSKQLSSMSRGGAGSIADSFLRSVEAALRLMLCSDYLILFTTLDDCILQSQSPHAALFNTNQSTAPSAQDGAKICIFLISNYFQKRKSSDNNPSTILTINLNSNTITNMYSLSSKPKPTPKSTFSNYHESAELKKNQTTLHNLYVKIMDDFVNALKDRELFSKKEGKKIALDSDKLANFAEAIKYYYNQTKPAYHQAVTKRQTGRKSQQQKTQPKKDQINYQEYLEEQSETEDLTASKQQNLCFQIPSLYNYKPLLLPKIEEPAFPMPSSNNHEHQTSSDSDSDSEDIMHYGAAAEKQANCLINGTFLVNKIKHKPKEEKMFLEMQDVFIKFAFNGRDAFFDRASIDLRKIEKADAPLE